MNKVMLITAALIVSSAGLYGIEHCVDGRRISSVELHFKPIKEIISTEAELLSFLKLVDNIGLFSVGNIIGTQEGPQYRVIGVKSKRRHTNSAFKKVVVLVDEGLDIRIDDTIKVDSLTYFKVKSIRHDVVHCRRGTQSWFKLSSWFEPIHVLSKEISLSEYTDIK